VDWLDNDPSPLDTSAGLRGRPSTVPSALFNPRTRAGRTALQLRDGIEFEDWCRMGEQVGELVDASAWWIGDWLVYGRRTFPDRYRSAIAATGFGYQTLRNYASIAARIPVYRRRDNLSFGHHAEVAALDEEDQEMWLLRCSVQGWSRNELRAALRDERNPSSPVTVQAVPIELEVGSVRHSRWCAAATADGRPLTDWIACVVDDAAESALRRKEHSLELAS
jgi:hypothetical protein